MYATTPARLRDQAAARARPRPFWSSRRYRTPGRTAASRVPITRVASVLALSAMVMTARNGNLSSR